MTQPPLTLISSIEPASHQSTMASGVVKPSCGTPTKYVTPPIVVNSQPEYDARIQAGNLRCADSNAYLPYFLEVRHDSDWHDIFCGPNWPFPHQWEHKGNPEYSKRVLYHIAAQNHMDVSHHVSKFLSEGRFGPQNDLEGIRHKAFCNRAHDLFTPQEIDHYSEAFLSKVFLWLQMCFEQQNTTVVPKTQQNGSKMPTSKSASNLLNLNSKKNKPEHRKTLSSKSASCTAILVLTVA
jgi:hypothetical protein